MAVTATSESSAAAAGSSEASRPKVDNRAEPDVRD